jgi:hypothetical protein
VSWLSRLLGGKNRGGTALEERPDGPVEDVPALARYVAESLGWDWHPVGVMTDPQGPIIVFRDAATGRTQPICLTQQPDSWSLRAEIEREIRKAMAARGVSIPGNQ